MQTSGKAYFTGALGVLASKVINMLAGIISLWLLTTILTTEDFAGYSVAMSIVILLGYSASLGIERSMLLRIGELEPDGRALAGRRLALRILVVVACLAAAAGFAAYLWANSAGTTPRHEFVARLAAVIPATAMSLVLVTWFQANHRVGVSQMMIGLSDATRATIFAITLILGLGTAGVAAGAIIGAAAPLAFLSYKALGHTQPEPRDLGLQDLVTGFQFLLMRLSWMGLRHLDIIAMGALGSPKGTAQYVAASRFATLVESGQSIFAPTFAPRVRRHLSTGRSDLAEREYYVSRVAGFTAALAFSIFLVVAGRTILQEFGDFGVGFGPFMVLVAANLFMVGTGMHSTFLSMTDQLGRTTAIRVLSLAVFFACLWVLVPRFDALGAAFSLLIATTTHETAGVIVLRRYLKITALRPADALILFVVCAALCAIGTGYLGTIPGAAIMLGMLAFGIAREWGLLIGVARDMTGIVRRQN